MHIQSHIYTFIIEYNTVVFDQYSFYDLVSPKKDFLVYFSVFFTTEQLVAVDVDDFEIFEITPFLSNISAAICSHHVWTR